MSDQYDPRYERVKVTLLVVFAPEVRIHGLTRRLQARRIAGVVRVGAPTDQDGMMLYPMDLRGREEDVQAVVQGLQASRTRAGIIYYYVSADMGLVIPTRKRTLDTGRSLVQMGLDARVRKSRPSRGAPSKKYSPGQQLRNYNAPRPGNSGYQAGW